jgi:hypothetical protein
MSKLHGKIAVINGGSSGIGLASAPLHIPSAYSCRRRGPWSPYFLMAGCARLGLFRSRSAGSRQIVAHVPRLCLHGGGLFLRQTEAR